MKGILFKTENGCTTVMKKDGTFVDIACKRNRSIGQEVNYLMSKAAKVVLSSLVSIALILTLAFGGYNNYIATASTVINVDINPSVSLELNALDHVVKAFPNNPDAQALLASIDLTGLSVGEAIQKIVALAIEKGYITPDEEDNAILLSTSGDEGEEIQDKLDKLAEQIQNELNNRSIKATLLTEVPSEENRDLAEALGVTPGKFLLMQKAVRLDSTLSLEAIASWSIKDLNAVIKYAFTQSKASGTQSRLEERLSSQASNSQQVQQQLDRLREKLEKKLGRISRPVISSSSSSSASSSTGSSESSSSGTDSSSESSSESASA